MTRDYAQAARRRGLWVPRWAIVLAGAGLLGWVALRILVPPAVVIQRLDSPDGSARAVLQRVRYVDDHYRIQVRTGRLWETVFYSGAYTNDFRVDRFERLRWSEDSSRLYFSIEGRDVWEYAIAGRQPRAIPPGGGEASP